MQLLSDLAAKVAVTAPFDVNTLDEMGEDETATGIVMSDDQMRCWALIRDMTSAASKLSKEHALTCDGGGPSCEAVRISLTQYAVESSLLTRAFWDSIYWAVGYPAHVVTVGIRMGGAIVTRKINLPSSFMVAIESTPMPESQAALRALGHIM